jgi:hypothetical protein
MKYVKKPVVISAFRYGIDARPDWFDSKVTSNEIITHIGIDRKETQDYYCEIKTLEGVMVGKLGDYIIQGIQGEVYPCKPDIFEKTYLAYQPKRKPLPCGTLQLTDSEKAEFADIIRIPAVYRVVCSREYVIYYISPYHVPVYVDNYKAIQYILEKFDLQNSNGDN